MFDPFDLEIDITPANVRKTLKNREYATALMLAFRLNEEALIQEVVETIQTEDSKFTHGYQYITCIAAQ